MSRLLPSLSVPLPTTRSDEVQNELQTIPPSTTTNAPTTARPNKGDAEEGGERFFEDEEEVGLGLGFVVLEAGFELGLVVELEEVEDTNPMEMNLKQASERREGG